LVISFDAKMVDFLVEHKRLTKIGVEQKVDEEGIYKKDFLLHKYVITDFGKVRGSDACLRYA
jgi:hypothetical protein